MKKAVSAAVSGLLCVCFSLTALFAAQWTVGWLFAAFILICLICCSFSVKAKSAFLRVVWMLPPALLLVPAYGRPAFMLLLAAWGAALVLTTVEPAHPTYRSLRRIFPLLAGLSLFAISMIAANSLGISFPEFENCDPFTVCGFAVGGLALLCYALVSLRAGCPGLVRWRAQTAAGVLLPALSGGVLMLISPLLGKLGVLLMMPFVWLFRLFAYVMSLFSRPSTLPPSNYAPEETLPTEHAAPIPNGGPRPDLSEIETLKPLPSFPWKRAALIAGIILAVGLAAYLLIRWIRRPRTADETDQLVMATPELQDSPARIRRPRRRRAAAQDESQRIREYYRLYLRYRKRTGQEILPSQTSEDILYNPERDDTASDAEKNLRGLYLRARYARNNGLTESDVSTAESLLHLLMSQDGAG